MPAYPCFIYREGEHFTLPRELRFTPPNLCEFALQDDSGRIIPHPQVFYETPNPDEAAFFLFPWDIGKFMDSGKSLAVEAVIASLPYLRGRERRHIVCDDGDGVAISRSGLCLFKISLKEQDRNEAVCSWYRLPAHVADDTPSFDWDAIRYDVSFVGNVTNVTRKAVALAVQRTEGLRSRIDFDDAFKVEGQYFYNRAKAESALRGRQDLYRNIARMSFAVLCPPGVGPQSIRMYETMYLGRIPVIFGENTVYPLAGSVDYTSFCLRVASGDLLRAGERIRDWIGLQGRERLQEICVLACRTWNRYFTPEKKLPLLLEEAARLWGLS
ncbi:MAG: glycosyltransferase family 47 protein [Desulfovibrio sp.]|jgi:hypothetical protein|nr:glycosyltransferase family 47 protein [Desulfovibrio sp.]